MRCWYLINLVYTTYGRFALASKNMTMARTLFSSSKKICTPAGCCTLPRFIV